MDEPDGRRIDEVRGEPWDEMRFLSHLVVERVYDRLPSEFWLHLNTARTEVREALLVLLRAWVEYLSREEGAERGTISGQRGRIAVTEADPTPAEAAPPDLPASMACITPSLRPPLPRPSAASEPESVWNRQQRAG